MIRFDHNGYTLSAFVDKYKTNNTPCIICEDEFGEVYGILTVNLDDPIISTMNMDQDDPWFYQYVNISDWPRIEDDLASCDWCEPTGWTKRSGFVNFPIYKFDKEVFNVE